MRTRFGSPASTRCDKKFVDTLDRQVRLEGAAENQLVESAFQFAAAGRDVAGDMAEDIGGNVERGIILARGCRGGA